MFEHLGVTYLFKGEGIIGRTMDWEYWKGKRIFVKLNTGAVYSGKVIDVYIFNKEKIWFSMIDQKGDRVTFVHTEILKLKEEKEE